jgi:hypothetical protein
MSMVPELPPWSDWSQSSNLQQEKSGDDLIITRSIAWNLLEKINNKIKAVYTRFTWESSNKDQLRS